MCDYQISVHGVFNIILMATPLLLGEKDIKINVLDKYED